MTEPEKAGKLDWVSIAALALTAIGMLAAPLLYLNSTLHQIDLRLTRIETTLGVEQAAVKLSSR